MHALKLRCDVVLMSRSLGRKATIQIAAACFIVGSALCAGAEHVAMLIVGRLLLGCGVGFANQVCIWRCKIPCNTSIWHWLLGPHCFPC